MARTWIKATPENLAELREECSGRVGDFEAEGSLHWCKWEPEHVDLYSCKGAEIAGVIDRCGSAIMKWHKHQDGVTLRIRRRTEDGKKVFRGLKFAFTPLDVESKPFPSAE